MVRWIPNEKKLNADVFLDLEEQTSVTIPRDFVDFYCQYQGIEGTEGDLFINVEEDSLQFDDLLPIEDMNEKYQQIVKLGINANKQGTLIPFGYDSALDWYAFYYAPGKEVPQIIWMERASLSNLLEEPILNVVKKVRNSFTDFLKDLYEERATNK